MKTLNARHKWMQIVFGALFLLAGIAVIVIEYNWPDYTDRSLSVVLAVALFIFAAIMFFSSLFAETKSIFSAALIYGSLFVALGVVLLVNPYLISTIFVTMLAVFIIALGAICLFKAAILIFFRMKWYYPAILFALGTIGIVGGILALCYPGVAFTVTFVILGIGLVALGAYEIIIAILAMKSGNKSAEEKAE